MQAIDVTEALETADVTEDADAPETKTDVDPSCG